LGEVNYGSEAGPAQAAAAFAVPFVLIVPIVLGKQCVVARRFVLVAVRRVCRSIRGAGRAALVLLCRSSCRSSASAKSVLSAGFLMIRP